MHNLRLSEEKNIRDIKRTKFPFNDASYYTKVQRKKATLHCVVNEMQSWNAFLRCIFVFFQSWIWWGGVKINHSRERNIIWLYHQEYLDFILFNTIFWTKKIIASMSHTYLINNNKKEEMENRKKNLIQVNENFIEDSPNELMIENNPKSPRLTRSRSTYRSSKDTSSLKRSHTVRQRVKPIQRYDSINPSDFTKPSSQQSILQLPASNGYKVCMKKSFKL